VTEKVQTIACIQNIRKIIAFKAFWESRHKKKPRALARGFSFVEMVQLPN
jgi:hypothetical protein